MINLPFGYAEQLRFKTPSPDLRPALCQQAAGQGDARPQARRCPAEGARVPPLGLFYSGDPSTSGSLTEGLKTKHDLTQHVSCSA